MKIIGVTGGIGAGKSSVSGILRDLGCEVIDADQLSHAVVKPGRPAWQKIIEAFGEGVLQADGNLDRKKLAGIVFHSRESKEQLEAIVHAEVIMEMKNRIDELEKAGYEGCIVLDVPIPVEIGFLDTVDTVWVVTAEDEKRIRRIMERSGLSAQEAAARMRSQLSAEEYQKLANVIIENNGSMEELKEQVISNLGIL